MEQKNFPHDAIYKAIFSEKPLVKSLLLDFVKLPCVEGFDFSTLELFPANYVTPAFSRHESDLVWRVEMNGSACIIFLMLEFQSHPEKWMAARIANYANLLLNSLIASTPVNMSLEHGLPPVLPVVIYNGKTRWGAPKNMADLFMPMPTELRAFQPGQKYFLLDIRHITEKIVREAHGEASYFVRMERAKTSQDILAIIGDVLKTCAGQEYDRFRRLLGNFILCCLERGSWEKDLERPMPLEEFAMLYDDYPEWVTNERNNAIKEGLKEGRKEGRKEERAAILGELMASLKTQLIERFGSLPQTWIKPLAQIADPSKIIKLSSAVYAVASQEEFETKLLDMTKS